MAHEWLTVDDSCLMIKEQSAVATTELSLVFIDDVIDICDFYFRVPLIGSL